MKISDGDHIKHTPGSDLAAGDVVAFANMIGIAETAIQAGEVGSLAISGLFEMDREPMLQPTLAAGSRLYWSPTMQQVRIGPTGAIPIGHSIELSKRTETKIKVLLRQ